MRKAYGILPVLISASLLVSLAGCGTKEPETTAAQTAAVQTTLAESSVETAAAETETVPDAESADYIDIVLSENGAAVNGQAAGTDSSAAVYAANDIIYYEDRDNYDSGNPYGEGTASDRHTAEEAAADRKSVV